MVAEEDLLMRSLPEEVDLRPGAVISASAIFSRSLRRTLVRMMPRVTNKYPLASGSVLTVPPVYLLFGICFAVTALILTAQAPDKVAVALVDQCGGVHSSRLCEDLLACEELDVTPYASVREAEDALLSGVCEASLTIRA